MAFVYKGVMKMLEKSLTENTNETGLSFPINQESIVLTSEQVKRIADAAAIKMQAAPLREPETCTIRPCYSDVIHSYKKIEGSGFEKPENLCVHYNTLWEQEAVDENNLLLAAVERHKKYFEAYPFPENPDILKSIIPMDL
jgi:hypothetical protein